MRDWWLEFFRGLAGGLIMGCMALVTGLFLAAIAFMLLFLVVVFFG